MTGMKGGAEYIDRALILADKEKFCNFAIDQAAEKNVGHRLTVKDLTGSQKDILNFCSVPRSAAEIMERLSICKSKENKA